MTPKPAMVTSIEQVHPLMTAEVTTKGEHMIDMSRYRPGQIGMRLAKIAANASAPAPAQHTPGPWTTKDQGGYQRKRTDGTPWRSLIVGTESDRVVAEVAIPKGAGWYDAGALANARLIASAPDLLAALEGIYTMIENGYLVRNTDADNDPDWAKQAMLLVARLNAARAAIAKAKA